MKAPRRSQDCNAQLQAQSGFEQLVIATSASFAKKTFDERRRISRRMTTTQKKINLDSVTAQALFKGVTQVTNEINDTMIKDYRKRSHPLRPIAQASEFSVPGIKDTITKTSEGLDTFKYPLKALIHWICATSRICTTPSDICADGTGHIRLSPTGPRLLISWLKMASQGPYCWLDSADLIMKITFAHPQVCTAQKRPSVRRSVRVLVF